jgi:transposase
MIQPIAPDYGTNFLLPPALEDWVPASHPVRFLREYVDALDLATLGFAMPQAAEGRPPYAVGLLLKIWLYGYWHQTRSFRRLERACGNELPLLWLSGMITPDHNTLWRFWRDNNKAIRRLFKQSVELALKAGLVGLVVQALDGTKVQAVASGRSGWSKKTMEELLVKVEAHISELEQQIEAAGAVPSERGAELPANLQQPKQLRETIVQGLAQLEQTQREQISQPEQSTKAAGAEPAERGADLPANLQQPKQLPETVVQGPAPLEQTQREHNSQPEPSTKAAGAEPAERGAELPVNLQQQKQLRQTIVRGLAQLEQTQREHYHPHEPEARRMNCEGRQPFAYNAQAVVDSKAGIVTAAEVTQAEEDVGQLVPLLEQAKANTGAVAQDNTADGGYGSGSDLKLAQDAGYRVLAPVREGTPAKNNPYHAHQFQYEESTQTVTCPQGQKLDFQREAQQKGQQVRIYRCHCKSCPVREQCTTDPKGRKIEIWPHTSVVQAVRARLQTEEGKKVLSQRSQLIELMFAVIKNQFGFRRWTFRGLEKVRSQWAMLCLTINLRALWAGWKSGTLQLNFSKVRA